MSPWHRPPKKIPKDQDDLFRPDELDVHAYGGFAGMGGMLAHSRDEAFRAAGVDQGQSSFGWGMSLYAGAEIERRWAIEAQVAALHWY